jgi:hypothetical protein
VNGRPVFPILGASEDDSSNEPPADDSGDAAEPPTGDGDASLGDAGKRAIDRMKETAKAAVAAKKAAEAELAALKAQNQSAADVDAAITAATQKVALEYQSKVVAAEIKAAAVGKVVDPDLLGNLPEFDPSKFVTSDGDVDQAAIASAITDLVASKPYLAAQGGRSQGSADGGPRNGGSSVADRSTKDWIESMAKR